MKIDYQRTKAQDVPDHKLELLLVELDDAEVACITMRSDADTNGGSPADEPDNSLLSLAPFLLDIDEEVLEILDLGAGVGKLGLVLAQLLLRLDNVDSVLDPASKCRNLLLETRDCIDMRADQGLDGDQVLFERERAHDHDLLLRRGV